MESIILIVAAFITSSISAILGMGGGIILLGIMALIIPEGYLVIALHGIIQLVSNSTRSFVFRKDLKRDIISQYFLGALIGMFLSGLIIFVLIRLFQVDSANEIKVEFLKPLIGVFILWYLFLRSPKKEKSVESYFGVGGIGGISSVFIGATGPLIAPFFLDNRLTKENIIANKAACQVITHLGKIPLFIFFFNVNYIENYTLLLPLMIAVFLGTNFGKKILGFIPDNIFRMLFKYSLTIISLRLIFSDIF